MYGKIKVDIIDYLYIAGMIGSILLILNGIGVIHF